MPLGPGNGYHDGPQQDSARSQREVQLADMEIFVGTRLCTLPTKTGIVMLSAAKHLSAHRETLRCAQGDKILPILVGKLHNRVHRPLIVKEPAIRKRRKQS